MKVLGIMKIAATAMPSKNLMPQKGVAGNGVYRVAVVILPPVVVVKVAVKMVAKVVVIAAHNIS